ncbi:hypothetical protein [Leptolyngbya sp. FACHB-671]|nr:hypothetical protein [Leptolyngbya sp. FACHB-671]MBD1999932.1 hypothetical protein [Leptolyngbya sp. FACHB-541]
MSFLEVKFGLVRMVNRFTPDSVGKAIAPPLKHCFAKIQTVHSGGAFGYF